MTDDEREAQMRQLAYDHPKNATERERFLLRRLDEARKERDAFGDALQVASDEITRLRKQIRDDEAAMELIRQAAELIKTSPLIEQISELKAEITRLRAPAGSTTIIHSPEIPVTCLGHENCSLGFTSSVIENEGRITRLTVRWHCKTCEARWDVEEKWTCV